MAGTTGFAFSVFIPVMSEDLGWSRSLLVGAVSVSGAASSLLGPWAGNIIDRHGARSILIVSTVLGGLALAACGLVHEPWELYLYFGLLVGACRAAMQNVAPGTMVANWFIRRRALAFSIVAVAPPASSLVYPAAIAFVVDSHGWRAAWPVLGASAVVLALIPTIIFVRRRPEDMGLRPDGAPPGADAEVERKTAVASLEDDWTYKEVLRSRAFWLLVVSMSLVLLTPSMTVVTLFPTFYDQGMSATVAAATISVMSAFQLLSRIAFWGPAIAKLGSVQKVMWLWSGLLILACVFLSLARNEVSAYLASAFLGLAMGGNLVLQLQVWPEYFGRRAVGAVSGTAHLLMGATGAGGPFVGAMFIDATHDYTLLYLGLAGICALGLSLQFMIGRPHRPPRVVLAASG